MRENHIPQFTVDSHRPIGAFDVLGVSFATELGYTNLLNALDLAGIPLHAADRTIDDPIVLAGGHAAFNPEPLADFVDAAVLGDGEEAVGEITESSGRGRRRTDRAAATSCCCAWPRPAACTCRGSTTSPTAGDGAIAAVDAAPTPACRSGWPSAPPWTWTSGRTRSSRWCRSRRACTSG